MRFEREKGRESISAYAPGRVTVLYAAFFLVSFFGWILEEVFFFLRGQGLLDRGFLALPICPVYGIGVLATYLFFGVPDRMRFFSRSLPQPWNRRVRMLYYLFYTLLAGLVCTLSELAVGLLLDLLFGVLMWDYRDLTLHVGPYISFSYAVIWGALSLLFLHFLFLPILRMLHRTDKRALFAVLLPLSVLFIADLTLNCFYSFVTRTHLSLW